jgi:hypothetical protein
MLLSISYVFPTFCGFALFEQWPLYVADTTNSD